MRASACTPPEHAHVQGQELLTLFKFLGKLSISQKLELAQLQLN